MNTFWLIFSINTLAAAAQAELQLNSSLTPLQRTNLEKLVADGQATAFSFTPGAPTT